ncbi:MAG: hypothetical protein ACPG5T_07700, partial [Endozoicomonas sp.]
MTGSNHDWSFLYGTDVAFFQGRPLRGDFLMGANGKLIPLSIPLTSLITDQTLSRNHGQPWSNLDASDNKISGKTFHGEPQNRFFP